MRLQTTFVAVPPDELNEIIAAANPPSLPSLRCSGSHGRLLETARLL
jgi:hypothetical protein